MTEKWFPRLMRRRDKLKRKNFERAVGLCRECWEPTAVLSPCCGGDVEYNGIIFTRDDFEEEKPKGFVVTTKGRGSLVVG